MDRFKISAILASFALAAGLAAQSGRYREEARQQLHHTFSGDKSLDIDDVTGSIEVSGDGGNTIRVDGEEIIRGVDQQAIARARREVTLDINEKDGVAQLYVNGPFRDNNRSSGYHGFHEHNDKDYQVTFNFTVHVPRSTELRLSTVSGAIRADQTSGKFTVRNVNGEIAMTGIAGSGSVRTVNGKIGVSFRENPRESSEFHTVNGAIDATFQPTLSADLQLKTVNGHPYTDFEATALMPRTADAGRSDGKFVYRSNRSTSVRIGSGGPELSFETVNGDIHIQKAH